MTYEPGIHYGVSDDDYRTIGGLSSTGVKRILSSPALYDWHRRNPPETKSEWDLGHAVHNRVLGIGTDEVIVPGHWNTKAAKEAVAQAREAGATPLKPEHAAHADEMAAAVLDHPDASMLLTGGQPEVTILWDDPATGVRCRGRLDYWHDAAAVAVDLKTTKDAHPHRFARSAPDYGYPEQMEHYGNGVEVLTGKRPRFLHVLCQTDGPPLVSVVELDDQFARVGAANARAAVEMYRDCTEADIWPGIPHGVHRVSPPRWYAPHAELEYA